MRSSSIAVAQSELYPVNPSLRTPAVGGVVSSWGCDQIRMARRIEVLDPVALSSLA